MRALRGSKSSGGCWSGCRPRCQQLRRLLLTKSSAPLATNHGFTDSNMHLHIKAHFGKSGFIAAQSWCDVHGRIGDELEAAFRRITAAENRRLHLEQQLQVGSLPLESSGCFSKVSTAVIPDDAGTSSEHMFICPEHCKYADTPNALLPEKYSW